VGSDVVIVAIILAVPALLVAQVVRPRLEQRRLGKAVTESNRQVDPGGSKSDKVLGRPDTDSPRALNP
jgi:hypothetical protein